MKVKISQLSKTYPGGIQARDRWLRGTHRRWVCVHGERGMRASGAASPPVSAYLIQDCAAK